MFPDYYFDIYSFDWFLCDKVGNLALLSACISYVPNSITRFSNPSSYLVLQEYINTLPIISSNIILSEFIKQDMIENAKLYSTPDRYIEVYSFFAKRGLFAYDCEPHTNLYNLIAIPEISLNIKSLPAEIQNIIYKTRIDTLLLDTLIIDASNIE